MPKKIALKPPDQRTIIRQLAIWIPRSSPPATVLVPSESVDDLPP